MRLRDRGPVARGCLVLFLVVAYGVISGRFVAAEPPAGTAPGASPPATPSEAEPAHGADVLTLDQCIRLALEKSPSYRGAEERLYASRGGVGLARANLLPQLSLSTDARRVSPQLTFYSSLGDVVRSSRYYQGDLNLNQQLFDGFASWNRLEASRRRRDAADAGLRDGRLNTVLRVKEAYLELLRARHLYDVSNGELDASRRRQERVEALFDVGSVARTDVLQNKVQLAQDELSMISARNQVDIARVSLLNAMGVDMSRPIDVAEVALPDPGEVPDVAALIPEAAGKNASLADLHGQTRAARADFDAARGARYPSLNLSWNYGFQDYRFPGSFGAIGDHDSWAASLLLRFNLFDGLATESSITTSRHTYEEARLREEQARLDLALEVRRQHSSLMEARERIRVAGESVSSAEERVRLEEERYRLGSATLLQLIDAQVALTRAKTSEVEARYDHSLAWARLERALGRE